jgi:hypothetical protein
MTVPAISILLRIFSVISPVNGARSTRSTLWPTALTAEASDLGVGEGDEELLAGLAEVVVELDLDRA